MQPLLDGHPPNPFQGKIRERRLALTQTLTLRNPVTGLVSRNLDLPLPLPLPLTLTLTLTLRVASNTPTMLRISLST